jgi:endonuclease/exonuclease/phosphatase family metal-dependent hydrolase
VKIVSLNAWGGKLGAPLTDYLRTAAPDVLCLQEVVHTPAATKEWLTYRDGDHVLPQRTNLFAELVAALPDHAGTFCPAAQGELWDGEVAVPSQFGVATFVRRSLPVIGQVQGFVHGAYSAHGYGAHPRPRNAHVVRVFDYGRGAAVTIGHMHGLRDLAAGKADTPERLAQAKALARLVQAVAEPGDPVVVCGDFNVEPGSATFAVLGEIGLADLVARHGITSTRTSHYTKPGRFADYMLVNEQASVREFTVVTVPEVSDHCPLVLELRGGQTGARGFRPGNPVLC